jgi:hypothetical protein
MAVCHYHPDRTAIGVCMRCRRVICAACSTRVDGINHCHACLTALGNRQFVKTGGGGSRVKLVLLLGLGWLVLFGAMWLLQGRLAP